MNTFNCENCGKEFKRYGKSNYKHHYCSRQCHYKSGEPRADLRTRFLKKISFEASGCWVWTGSRHKFGYGWIYDHSVRKRITSHRGSWRLFKGAIPEGLEVLHKCDNPPCVNPEHLFLGTQKDNGEDMAAKRRSTIGEKNPQVKLTEEDAKKIKFFAQQGILAQREIAEMFSISTATVQAIKHGLRWKHI